jgi:hypothetical protein
MFEHKFQGKASHGKTLEENEYIGYACMYAYHI